MTFRILLLTMFLAVLSGCPTTVQTGEPCSASSCFGCCDANGQCQTGGADNACGSNGFACTNCSNTGAICTAGLCMQRPSSGGGNGGGSVSTGGGEATTGGGEGGGSTSTGGGEGGGGGTTSTGGGSAGGGSPSGGGSGGGGGSASGGGSGGGGGSTPDGGSGGGIGGGSGGGGTTSSGWQTLSSTEPTGNRCRLDGWCYETGFPRFAYSFFALSSTALYAAGDRGEVSLFDGQRWSMLPTPTYATLNSVHGTSANDVWAVGSQGTVLHFTNGSFSNVTTPAAGVNMTSVLALSPTNAWAVGYGSTLLRYDGATWTKSTYAFNDSLMKVVGLTASEVYVLGYSGLWEWNGSSFTSINRPNGRLNDLVVTGPGSVFAVGENATVYRRTSSGWALVSVPVSISGDFRHVSATSPTDVWIESVNSSNTSRFVHYDGTAFSYAHASTVTTPSLTTLLSLDSTHLISSTPSKIIRVDPTSITELNDSPFTWAPSNGLWSSGPNELWLTGSNGVFRYDGSTWFKNVEAMVPQSAYAVWGTDSGDRFVLSGDNVYRWRSGQGWSSTQLSTGFSTQASVLGGSSGNDVWAVGAGGAAYHYDGAAWASFPVTTSARLNAIYAGTANATWAVSDAGGIFKWDGVRWTAQSVTTNGVSLQSVNASPSGEIWVGGASSALFRFDGTTWSSVAGPATSETISGILPLADGRLMVRNSSGVWMRTGTTWTAMGGLVPASFFAGRNFAWMTAGDTVLRFGTQHGDTCADPLSLVVGTPSSALIGTYANDYSGAGQGCTAGAGGPDVVFQVSVPAGNSVTVTGTPVGGLDVSLSLVESVTACTSRRCIVAANQQGAGGVETVSWNNTSAVTQQIYVIADTASGSGSVTVSASIGGQVTCNAASCAGGCCVNNVCQSGTTTLSCGAGGGTCSACGSYQQCGAAQTCIDNGSVDRATGAQCTASSQCGVGVIENSATCKTTWPGGGMCTSTCLFSNYSCGPLLAGGWCTSGGECLPKCAAPNGGQSDCRTGYVCDSSNGASTQGVCRPRCDLIACTSGTCQASGYCR